MWRISNITDKKGAPRCERGVTLLELAVALLVLGAALSLLAPWIGLRIHSDKNAEARRSVVAARDHLIGWAMLQPAGAKRLPSRETAGLPLDPWGRPLVYVPDDASVSGTQDLTSGDLCARAQTDLRLRLPGGDVATNLAFVVASRGKRVGPGADHAYEGNPIDLSERTKDDLVEYVSLDQLSASVCGR